MTVGRLDQIGKTGADFHLRRGDKGQLLVVSCRPHRYHQHRLHLVSLVFNRLQAVACTQLLQDSFNLALTLKGLTSLAGKV